MNLLTRSMRWLAPLGLMENHRRRFQMRQLGLPGTRAAAEAVEACRFDLWPLFLRQPSDPWMLVDVGANEGDFTRAAAQLTNLSAVHAFEPQPACHASLRQALNLVPGSHLHAAAVGKEKGDIELLCTTNSKLSSVLVPDAKVAAGYGHDDFSVQKRLTVPLVSLDDVIPAGTDIGLLKIDVQGFELPVLEGALRTLRSTRALLMEVNYVPHYEGGAAFDELHEAVRSHGFRTFGISAPYGGPAGPLWADAMFVKA